MPCASPTNPLQPSPHEAGHPDFTFGCVLGLFSPQDMPPALRRTPVDSVLLADMGVWCGGMVEALAAGAVRMLAHKLRQVGLDRLQVAQIDVDLLEGDLDAGRAQR